MSGMPKGVRKTPPQPWPAHGWEYRDVSLSYAGSWADALNELGREGWMVVSVVHDEDPDGGNDEVRVLLMRPGDRDFRRLAPAPSLDRADAGKVERAGEDETDEDESEADDERG